MEITGLHLLLTYQCTFECDHCFVWGSPWQTGTMTLANIREILRQGVELGTVESIYFEGGEPALYYSILLRGVQEARALGFHTGIVSNAYWANSLEDALEVLKPFAGLLDDLSVSSDLAKPEALQDTEQVGQLPLGDASVMYRGRAAVKLAPQVEHHPWHGYTRCPYEDLEDPGRVHVDPLGYLHVCQGICMGNLFQSPLKELVATYDPQNMPVISALLAGGPAEIVRRYGLPHQENYADACHLCYEARLALRERFPELLAPDQVYGEPGN
jgi:hypothetical protein